jgi:branched-chain amino acid transport system substrate-binding protein
MISPMSSNPATTAGKRYVFRLAFLDDVQGDVLARFATGDLAARRAAVLYDISTAYSRDLAARFRDRFTALGGRVVGFESYTADRKEDVRAQLRRLAAQRPDVLFLPNFPDAVPAQLQQAYEVGLRATFLGCDSWDPQSLRALPPGARAFVTNQWRPDMPLDAARRFATVFRAAYTVEPRATAAMSYDAVRILLDAFGRAGSVEPDRVRDALLATRFFAGASGTLTFDGRPDPVREVAVSEVKDRSLVTVRLVQPQ